MRMFSLISVVIFFIIEWFMLGRLFIEVDNRLATGEWTNNLLFRVVVGAERAATLR